MSEPADDEQTEFLNVDLEVFSREPLAVFARGLGRSVHVLYEGRWARKYAACIELWSSGYGQSADVLIRRMVRLIDKLPRPAKRLWKSAQIRQFNVGIQSSFKPRTFELHLQRDTLQAAARVGARVVVTVYAAELTSSSEQRTGA